MPMFLTVTTEDAPGCPAGSAISRMELDQPTDIWPGLETVPDDGRELWVPPPPVPPAITNFQARAVLLAMASPTGVEGRTLFQDIDDTLRGEGGVAWQAWEYANEITRDGELVSSLGQRLGMSPAQLDQLFIAAGSISA